MPYGLGLYDPGPLSQRAAALQQRFARSTLICLGPLILLGCLLAERETRTDARCIKGPARRESRARSHLVTPLTR